MKKKEHLIREQLAEKIEYEWTLRPYASEKSYHWDTAETETV